MFGWLLLEVGAAPETLVTVALRSATLALGAAPSEVSQLVTLGAFDLVGFAIFLPDFIQIPIELLKEKKCRQSDEIWFFF